MIVKISLRIASSMLIALSVAPVASAAKSHLLGDQESLLAAVRTEALEYTKKLPNFTCTQITLRETSAMNTAANGMSRTNLGAVVSSDEIEESLTYFDQHEHYEVIGVNGAKATGVQHMDFVGAISAGEFGSLLSQVFDPRSGTVFTWDRVTSLRGRRSYVFAFQVPRQAGSRVFDKTSGKEITASFAGRIFVDSDTKEVLRLTAHFDLPNGFPIETAESTVDYKPINIAGINYNLPFHSEVYIDGRGHIFVNKIDFKAYRKFVTEMKIRYGSLAEQLVHDEGLEAPIPSLPADSSSSPPRPSDPPALSQTGQPDASVLAADTRVAQSAPQTKPPLPAVTAELAEIIPQGATQPSPVAKMEPSNQPIVDAQLESVGLHVRADLVLVPVVVRDAAGRAVGNLTRDDFQLFDKGKRQEIKSFSLERRAEPPSEKEMPRGTKGTPQDNSGNQISPSNLVVYLFDDVHLKFGDLGQVRDAAARQMDTLQPTEQAAILATSGLVQLPFTSDKTRLHQALLQLRAQPLGGPSGDHCPDVSYYQADQMLNVYPLDLASNPPLQAAYADVIACMNGDSSAGKFAQTMAINAARVAEQTGKRESRGVLLAIRDVIHWLSQKPGRKTVILVSPGFILSADLLLEEGDVIDQAIRAGVNISTLDARGLYTGLPAIDRNYRSGTSSVFRIKTGLELEEATASAGVLRDLAEGTGGTQVRDTNDLYGGLQSLATPPEYTYMLGFKPEASKLDGSFHPLQVKLNTRANLYPQARRGYYAANQ